MRELRDPKIVKKLMEVRLKEAKRSEAVLVQEEQEAWKKFGITLWSEAGKVVNSALGGFPVDRPALNPLDKSVHASWKTHEGGLYDMWNSRK